LRGLRGRRRGSVHIRRHDGAWGSVLDHNCDEDKKVFEITIFCMGSLVGFYVINDMSLAEKLFSRLKRLCHALCVVVVGRKSNQSDRSI
jgi:hypothetical protein